MKELKIKYLGGAGNLVADKVETLVPVKGFGVQILFGIFRKDENPLSADPFHKY